jgi:hypothetical protein
MKRNRILLASLLLAVGVFALKLPAQALTVSPPTYDYTLNPGDTIRDTIKLYNEGTTPLTVYPEIYNFTYTEGDETSGTPSFYPADEVKNGFELGPWITTSSQPVTLQPGERTSQDFTIAIPKNASPGSHFGSIQLKSAPSTGTGGPTVSLVGGTGILILVRINGAVDDTMAVTRFGGDKLVYTSLPIDFHTRLENRGNIHLRPTGNIFVTNLFGQQVSTMTVNGDYRTILPKSPRRFDNTWVKHVLASNASEFTKEWRNFAFGRYQATLVLNYGPENKVITASYAFWVIPWMVLLIIVGGIALLVLAFVFGLKAYTKGVIRKYEKMAKKMKEELKAEAEKEAKK